MPVFRRTAHFILVVGFLILLDTGLGLRSLDHPLGVPFQVTLSIVSPVPAAGQEVGENECHWCVDAPEGTEGAVCSTERPSQWWLAFFSYNSCNTLVLSEQQCEENNLIFPCSGCGIEPGDRCRGDEDDLPLLAVRTVAPSGVLNRLASDAVRISSGAEQLECSGHIVGYRDLDPSGGFSSITIRMVEARDMPFRTRLSALAVSSLGFMARITPAGIR